MATYGSDYEAKLLPSSNDEFAGKSNEPPLYKKFLALTATISSFATLIVTVAYARNSDTTNNFLGGLDFEKLIFNWHPVFMVAGMIVCFVNALLSFLYLPFDKPVNKMIHGFLHSATIIFNILGLSCVIIGNNNKDHNTGDSYFPNLVSLHSYVGLGALLLYSQNYILGIVYFVAPIFSIPMRKLYKSHHVLLGTVTLFLALAAVVSGAMELYGEAGAYGGNACGYSLSSADTNPAENYGKMSSGCRTLNAIGILAMLSVVSAVLAVVEVKTRS